MIAQHAAEGGVLGEMERGIKSLGDGRVLPHTPQPAYDLTPIFRSMVIAGHQLVNAD